MVRNKWLEYMESQVAANPSLSKLATPSKQLVCDWISAGLNYLQMKEEMVDKSFLVCGITNALDGSENRFIHCTKELPSIQLPYVNESEDPFQSCDDDYESSADKNDDKESDLETQEVICID